LEFSPETAHVSIYTAFLGHLGTLPVFALKAKTGGFPSRQGSGWFCGVGRAVGDLREWRGIADRGLLARTSHRPSMPAIPAATFAC